VMLAADDQHQQWTLRRSAIAPHLSADRLALLDERFRPERQCPQSLVPPMEGPADLLFASQLAAALETTPAKVRAGRPVGSGKLSLDEWLSRYQAMVRLVDSTHTTWAYLSSLLYQRGELHGLSAKATTSYRRVTELGLQHLQAMLALAAQHPDRFRAMFVLPQVYQPGILTDSGRRLCPAHRHAQARAGR
jgi:hypothetical protein